MRPWQVLEHGHAASSDGALSICIRDVMRLVASIGLMRAIAARGAGLQLPELIHRSALLPVFCLGLARGQWYSHRTASKLVWITCCLVQNLIDAESVAKARCCAFDGL